MMIATSCHRKSDAPWPTMPRLTWIALSAPHLQKLLVLPGHGSAS
jgi:hypothetical protein